MKARAGAALETAPVATGPLRPGDPLSLSRMQKRKKQPKGDAVQGSAAAIGETQEPAGHRRALSAFWEPSALPAMMRTLLPSRDSTDARPPPLASAPGS